MTGEINDKNKGVYQDEQLVVFKLWSQNYAINIALVQEIILMEHITRVPRTPSFLTGVINLRGKIIPVIDMRKRFSEDQAAAITEDTRIVIVKPSDFIVGMIVDQVTEVIHLAKENIEPLPTASADFDASFIRGVGKENNELIMLLDVHDVFSSISKSEIA